MESPPTEHAPVGHMGLLVRRIVTIMMRLRSSNSTLVHGIMVKFGDCLIMTFVTSLLAAENNLMVTMLILKEYHPMARLIITKMILPLTGRDSELGDIPLLFLPKVEKTHFKRTRGKGVYIILRDIRAGLQEQT